MKYEILIEGGFTGIPKKYNGHMDVQEEVKENLLEFLGPKTNSENEALRDGLQYHFKLIDGQEEYNARFNETNLPLNLRQFIDTISKKK